MNNFYFSNNLYLLFTISTPHDAKNLLELQLAMKLAPDRKKFMDVICGTGDINADIEKFCTNFTPLLEENHKFLVSNFLLLYFTTMDNLMFDAV